jgi:hypothetical protein
MFLMPFPSLFGLLLLVPRDGIPASVALPQLWGIQRVDPIAFTLGLHWFYIRVPGQ